MISVYEALQGKSDNLLKEDEYRSESNLRDQLSKSLGEWTGATFNRIHLKNTDENIGV